MNYKKYQNNAYNLHIISTDKFKTNMIKINFKKKLEKVDVTYRNLLSKILLESNETYKTKRELEIECENLYNLSISGQNNISGNYIVSSFNAFFLNEKYTENDMNEKSFNFILDLIFKPNIKDKKFNNFDLAKRLVDDEINSSKENTRKYSLIRLLENMDKDLFFNPVGYNNDLEKVTNEDLYNYYLKMLKTDSIDIFIIGDIEPETIKKQIEKSFPINTLKKEKKNHFVEHKNIRKRSRTIKENLPLEQSKLNIGFKLDTLTNFERQYIMNIYTFILGGSPDSKLFKNVREKNSLCYTITCSYSPVSNVMIISAGINLDDFKKALSLIKKEINKMSKGDFKENDIDAAKLTYVNSLKDLEDVQPSILKIFESHEYLNYDFLDERSKNILNVTKEDIIKISKKIHLDTVYLLGGTDEEN